MSLQRWQQLLVIPKVKVFHSSKINSEKHDKAQQSSPTPRETRARYNSMEQAGELQTANLLRRQLPNHAPGPCAPGSVPSSFRSHLGSFEGRYAGSLRIFMSLLCQAGSWCQSKPSETTAAPHIPRLNKAPGSRTPHLSLSPQPGFLQRKTTTKTNKTKKLVATGASCVKLRGNKALWRDPENTLQPGAVSSHLFSGQAQLSILATLE